MSAFLGRLLLKENEEACASHPRVTEPVGLPEEALVHFWVIPTSQTLAVVCFPLSKSSISHLSRFSTSAESTRQDQIPLTPQAPSRLTLFM